MPVRHACAEAVQMTFFDPLKQANNMVIAKIMMAQKAKAGKLLNPNDNTRIDFYSCSRLEATAVSSPTFLLNPAKESIDQVRLLDFFDFSCHAYGSNGRVATISGNSSARISVSNESTAITTFCIGCHWASHAECSSFNTAKHSNTSLWPRRQAQIITARTKECIQSYDRWIGKCIKGSLQ
jgi:hypothetical protein